MSDMELKLDGACRDIAYIKQFIEDDRKKYADHLVSAEEYRAKVIRLEEEVKSHSTEHIYYRWLFGIIITVGLALLVK
jgi:hypothetical protein